MQEFVYKDYVEKLKAARKAKFHTQEEISEVLGIKRVTYARYETSGFPPIPVLYKLCKILDISVDYLLEPFENIKSEEEDKDTDNK